MSDHCLILLCLDFSYKLLEQKSTLVQMFSKFAWNDKLKVKFHARIHSDSVRAKLVQFSNFAWTDSNAACEKLTEILQMTARECLPIRKSSGHSSSHKIRLSNACFELRKKTHSLCKAFQKSPGDLLVHTLYYNTKKAFGQMVKHEKLLAKGKEIIDLAHTEQTNPQNIWDKVKKLSKNRSDISDSTPARTPDEE